MHCPTCRTALREGARYCQRCGASAPASPPKPPPAPTAGIPLAPYRVSRPKGMAIAGMVCGLASVVFWIMPVFGLTMAILGTGFGGGGLRRANAGVGGGRGMAIAGLACGIVGLVWGLVYHLMLIAAGEGIMGLINAIGRGM